MPKVAGIYEQLTVFGTTEYVVYYDDGSVRMFKNYPTEEDLNG
jgi:hypothetical protein